MLTVITAIVVFGSILVIFGESLPNGRFWIIMRKVVLFFPILIIGIVLYVIGDFKNNRVGYVIIFMALSFLAWGAYMSFKAGPSSPGGWDY